MDYTLKDLKRGILKFLIVFIIIVFAINPLEINAVKTINSQEFFTYHINDIIKTFDKSENPEMYLSTGKYEEGEKDQIFGIGKGRNLIVIQMESMQNFVVDFEYNNTEITPFINKLKEQEGSIYFDNFYQQLGSGNTSDAEFASNNSMLGTIESYTYQLYEKNYFRGLPVILKNEGYNTAAFHGYKKDFWNRQNIYPSLGFDKFYGDTEFESDNIKGLGSQNISGISDKEFFKQSSKIMKEMKQPFYSFMVTLSSHYPFLVPKEYNILGVSEADKSICTDYLNLIHYTDESLEVFFDELKAADLYENSIIVMYGDHFGMPKSDAEISSKMSEILGREYNYKELMNVPLLIHIPGEKINKKISISGGQVDLMPTLAYLMGVEELDTLYFGQNLLQAEKGFVPFQVQLLKGSFVKDNILFEVSRDGIFENSKAFNIYTGIEEKNIGKYKEDYLRATKIVELSEFYMKNDVLRLALEQKKSAVEISDRLSGKISMDKKFKYFSIEKNDEKGLENLIKFLRENKSSSVILSSDNTEMLLSLFKNKYSGTSGKTGTILSVDKESNEEYIKYKSRIIPSTCDLSVYSKLEYFGYDNIIFEFTHGKYTDNQIQEFFKLKNPSAVLIDFQDMKYQFNKLMEIDKPIIVNNIKNEIQMAEAGMLGAYGYVEYK